MRHIELDKHRKRRGFRFGYGVTVPAVALLAVYCFLVLAANSRVGTRVAVQIADRALPGSLIVEDLAVSPQLNRFLARNVSLLDSESREVIFASTFRCEIDLSTLIIGQLAFERCLAADGNVLVQEQLDGRIGIAAAFTRLDRNKGPRFGQMPLRWDHVDLYNIDVLVNLDDLSLLFRHTSAVNASIRVDDNGFQMDADRLRATDGRILLSERLLGFGPGPSNDETLRWEIERFQDPWKAAMRPSPASARGQRPPLDMPLRLLDMRDIKWRKQDVNFRALDLHADDIVAFAAGYVSFLPETPTLPPNERGVIAFDGETSIQFTAENRFLDFILPGVVKTLPGYDPQNTIKPLEMRTWGNIRFAQAGARFAIRDVDVMGWELTRFDADVSLDQGKLRIHPGASAWLWDGLVTGDATFEPKTGLWDARFCFEDIDFHAFADPLRILIAGAPPDWMLARASTVPSRCLPGQQSGIVLRGDMSSKAGFDRDPARMLPADAPLQDPYLVAERASVALEWPRGIANMPVRRATIDAAGVLDQRGVFHIDPSAGAVAHAAGARVLAHGSFDTMTSDLSQISARVDISNIKPWLEAAGVEAGPEAGIVSANLRFAGDMSAPRIASGRMTFEVPPGDLKIPSMITSFDLRESERGLSISNLTLTSSAGELSGSGSVDLFIDGNLFRPRAVPSVDAVLQARDVDLGLLPLDVEVDGSLVHGAFTIRGALNRPQLNGDFLFNGLRVANETFDIVQGTIAMQGPDVRVDNLDVIRGKGRIRGQLLYDLRREHVTLHAEGRRLRLREFTALRSAGDVDGELRFDVSAQGTTRDMSITGSTIVENFVIRGRDLGTATLVWDTHNENISGSGLIGKDLSVGITIPRTLSSAEIHGWFRRFPIADYLPELREAFGGSNTTGELFAAFDLRDDKGALGFDGMALSVSLDELDLRVGGYRNLGLRDSFCSNADASCERPVFTMTLQDSASGMKTELDVRGLSVGADQRFVNLTGSVAEGEINGLLSGELDLALLRLLPDLVADAEGFAVLNIEARGSSADPDLAGTIHVQNARVSPRGLGTTLRLDNMVMLVDGDTLLIPSDAERRLSGSIFGGDLGVSGGIRLRGFIPHAFDLNAEITGLAYRIPNELNITLNADVQLAAGEISDSMSWSIGGDVEIVDGRYYKDINIFADSFSIGGIGRSVDIFTQPIWITNPIIRDMAADLSVTGRDRLRVVSKIANAELNLELKTDLRVTGRLGKMVVTGEMRMLDNSRVYYGDRRFNFANGTLLFDGFIDEIGFPWPNMDARLETEFKSTCASRRLGTLDSTQTSSNLVRTTDVNPTIFMTVDVQGRLPLDMTFNLESSPYYDQRDQLSLIVTGCSVDELTGGDGSAPTLEFVFRPVISIVEQSVEERFNIDDVDLIPSPGGNADILVEDEVSERLTWTMDATVGSGSATRQSLSARLTIRNGLQLELLQESNTQTPFSLNGGLRFRWRLE